LKPFIADKCSTRFDLKLKWVYEFSISWMPCMNESNVNLHLNYPRFARWNKGSKWLSISYSIIIIMENHISNHNFINYIHLS
jgi:hypothetical protein